MPVPTVPQERFQDPQQNAHQLRVVQVLNAIVKIPILDGVLVSGTHVPTGGIVVKHGLARRPNGYLLLTQDVAGSIFENKSLRNTTDLVVASSAGIIVVDLWVF